jgi:hypothetical protein
MLTDPVDIVRGDLSRIIVLDGHDGAGKSTLCALLARRLGGHVVKPFDGKLGDFIGWLWADGRFEEADVTARLAIERDIALAPADGPLILDRHWLSLYTVLPEPLFPRWEPRPFTILCSADLPTTLERLRRRGEDPGDPHEHRYYIDLYKRLADRFEVPVIETTGLDPEDALGEIVRLWSARRS